MRHVAAQRPDHVAVAARVCRTFRSAVDEHLT